MNYEKFVLRRGAPADEEGKQAASQSRRYKLQPSGLRGTSNLQDELLFNTL